MLQKLPPMSPIRIQKKITNAPDLRSLPKKKVSFEASYNSLMNKLESKKKREEEEKEKEEEIMTPLPNQIIEPEIKTSKPEVSKPETKSEVKTSYFTKWEQEPILHPKTEEMEEKMIETIPIKKKDCKVLSLENEMVSYQKFRENPDHIIFLFQDIFYGYSKKSLFEDYKECHQKLYFILNLEEESLWIPMGQITQLLEYSHPVYEVEKTKFSIHLYSLKAIKLS